MWALATVYFKALSHLDAFEILSHRIIGSSILTLLVLLFLSKVHLAYSVLKDWRMILGLFLSTILIAANWGVFIWAIGEGLVLSASLGYYINPLVNILLGFLFLGERLNRVKLFATGLCFFAVILEIVNFGKMPYIALFLACTFGLYGLVRKKLGVDSFVGLGVETTLLLPLAIFIVMISPNDAARFVNTSFNQNVLLLLAGPITMLPLICFSAAANRIALSLMGFIQYIAPTGMFFLAIFLYGEKASPEKLTTFVLVWLAIGLLVGEGLRKLKKRGA